MPRPISADARARLGSVRGIMFDIDGCLVISNGPGGDDGHPLPGAVEALAHARASGRSVCVFTNGTATPPAAIAAHLRSLGLDVYDGEVLTPAVVAADFIARTYGDQQILVFGGDGMLVEFGKRDVNLVDVSRALAGEPIAPAAVVVGWDTEFGRSKLQLAAGAILGGARLYCTSDAPMFASRSELNVGVSGFITAGLQYVTGAEYEVLGKPSGHAMATIARTLRVAPEHVLVIGDDIRLEARMARAGGALGALVLTGTTTEADLASAPEASMPDFVVDALGDLVAHLVSADEGADQVGDVVAVE